MEGFIVPDKFLINETGSIAFFTEGRVGINKENLKHLTGSSCSIYMPIQRHTGDVHILTDNTEPIIADAVVTERNDIYIGVQTADCVPILINDTKSGAVGAVHAGWRGSAKEIVKNTLKVFLTKYNSKPENITVSIGPSIRSCCYEVGQEVVDALTKATGSGDYVYLKDGRWYVDLASANRIQAISMGVLNDNIWTSNDCTYCQSERFHSYRKTKTKNGRQGGFIGKTGRANKPL
ncbi:polyphenol oxidase [Candidatus Magnetoovum chiemensis]|nr:polyphenol oxidase [Candidatus Magnetoovum chiemensis]